MSAPAPFFKRIEILLVTLAGMIACAYYASRVGQDLGPDLVNYHYYTGWQALDLTRMDKNVFASNIQGYLNPYLYVFFYWLYQVLPPIGVGIVYGALHGLNLIATYALARVCFAHWPLRLAQAAALVAAGFGVVNPFFVALVGTSFSDNLTAPLVLAPLALILAIRFPAQPRVLTGRDYFWLLLAGLGLGACMGFKLSNCMFVLALAPAWLVRWRFSKEDFATALVTILGVVIGFLAVNGFWMWHLWTQYANPMFPFYNEIFKSPMLEHVWTNTPALAAADNLYEMLVYPFRWLQGKEQYTEWHFRDPRYAVIYILTAALIVTAIARRLFVKQVAAATAANPSYISGRWWFLAIWTFTAYLFWIDQFGAMRYLMPLTLITGILIVLLCDRLVRHRALALGLAALCMISIFPNMDRPEFGHVPWSTPWHPVQLPEPLASTPALYMQEGIGLPIPFFPEESQFIGHAFLGKQDGLSKRAREYVAAHQGPMRTLSNYRWSQHSDNLLKGYDLWRDGGDCVLFNVGPFVFQSCAVHRMPRPPVMNTVNLPVHVDFSKQHLTGLSSVAGLGAAELSGSWTDGPEPKLRLNGLLPRDFILLFSAHAYETNVDKPIIIKIGAQERTVMFGKTPKKIAERFTFGKDEPASDTISILIPNPVAPSSLDKANYDNRRLGLHISNVSVVSLDDVDVKWPGEIDVTKLDQARRVLAYSGFSLQEPTGRWTEGEKARIEFVNPLPRKFTLTIRASAFGPTINTLVPVMIGEQTYTINPGDTLQDMVLAVETKEPAKDLTIQILKPSSPSEQGNSSDTRKLGLFTEKITVTVP